MAVAETYIPTGNLKPVAEGVWIVDGPVPIWLLGPAAPLSHPHDAGTKTNVMRGAQP